MSKKTKKDRIQTALTLFAILFLGMFVFAGNKVLAQDSIQNIKISKDNIMTWDPFPGTAVYSYVCGEKDGTLSEDDYGFDMNAPSLNLNKLAALNGYDSGTYSVVISAWSDYEWNDGAQKLSADTVVEFQYQSKGKLGTPQNLRWDGDVARWDPVENSQGYSVNIYDVDRVGNLSFLCVFRTDDERSKIDLCNTDRLNNGSLYAFQVQAWNEEGYAASLWSECSLPHLLKGDDRENVHSVDLQIAKPEEAVPLEDAPLVRAEVSITGDDEGYLIDSAYWYNGADQETGEKDSAPTDFVEGLFYYAKITLKAKDGWRFTEDTLLNVNYYRYAHYEMSEDQSVLTLITLTRRLGYNKINVVVSTFGGEEGKTGGKVILDKDEAKPGETVHATFVPEPGFVLSSAMVGNAVEIGEDISETGEFVMWDKGDMQIDAGFKFQPIKVTPKITLSKTKYVYDGKAKMPAVTVKVNGKKLASSAYTVKKPSGRTKVGTYTVKVTLNGPYIGSGSAAFVINPAQTEITKLTAGKKSFTAGWKKTKETTGYQLQYATNSKFTVGKKTVPIKKNSIISRRIKNLKAKKKYYVRIRTYKTVGKKKYYSDWSKAKTVTIK